MRISTRDLVLVSPPYLWEEVLEAFPLIHLMKLKAPVPAMMIQSNILSAATPTSARHSRPLQPQQQPLNRRQLRLKTLTLAARVGVEIIMGKIAAMARITGIQILHLTRMMIIMMTIKTRIMVELVLMIRNTRLMMITMMKALLVLALTANRLSRPWLTQH